MLNYYDRVKFTTTTTGTGSVTVGSASTSFQTPATAGMQDADWTSYVIEDGSAWETGYAIASSSATVLSRTLSTSSTGSLLSLSGTAIMYFTLNAAAFNMYATRGALLATALGMFSR